MFETLDDSNFMLYAAKYYDNHGADVIEFEDDLARIKYIKRLFSKYRDGKELRERLILNHIIILYNVFGIKAANRMMWFKIEPEHYSTLKTFLVFLNYLPEDYKVEIPLDNNVIERLRNI